MARKRKRKKITVIGGGTGTYVVLSGLKNYPLDLAAIVTMMDSGGSTGRLRDQLGVLPPGDLRQCLVALSEAPLFWRKLFLYRFEKGDLGGHNFGNIFLSALEKICSNYDKVINTVSFVLKTKGKVIPVTYEQTDIYIEYENGSIIKGEENIDKNYQEKSRVKKAFLKPKALVNPKAKERILESDYLIIAPGDLYSSIISILLVSGIKETIKKSSAKIVYIVNLMTKSGQTTNYKASDHIFDLERYLGKKIDIVVINDGKIPEEILNWYLKEGEKPVCDDLQEVNFQGKIVTGDLIDKRGYEKSPADKFVDPKVRSILRHDSNKLAKLLMFIL